MGFTTACYIRKNSKELQNKLKELGYRICPCCDFENAVWLSTLISEPFKGEPSVHGIGYWDKEFEVSTPKQECEDFAKTTSNIDCGENEELFLALTALRDDSDYMQWFVCPKTHIKRLPGCFGQIVGMDGHYQEIVGYEWYRHENKDNALTERLNATIQMEVEDMEFLPHKATVEEIIEHFKK